MTTRAIFVTGTDTGAGKTFVSCAILAGLAARGLVVAACKPVETGVTVESGVRVGEDCRALAAATGGRQRASDVAAGLFLAPAAPLAAAEAEGTPIDPRSLAAHYHATARGADFVLVESAGGLMVPLSDGFTTRDLARDLGLATVVVVASRLGCINHALLTLEVLRASGMAVAGYVVNETGPRDEAHALALATNRDLLARFAGARELGVVPWMPAAAPIDAAAFLDLDALLAAAS